jgi:hypothetical protein
MPRPSSLVRRCETFATSTNEPRAMPTWLHGCDNLGGYLSTYPCPFRLIPRDSESVFLLYNSRMPPAKAKLKIVAQAALTARFVSVPRLTTPPNYHNWLETLLETPLNRKTFMFAEKTEVDDLLRVHAGQQFKNDNNLLNKALAQVCTYMAWQGPITNCMRLIRAIDDYQGRYRGLD